MKQRDYCQMFSSYRPNLKTAAYISTTFAYAIMHNIFGFYYVKMFLNYYHISTSWFQLSQIVFMVWNTVNDPLFGYFQDNSNWKLFKNRRFSILFGAPFYGLSFLVAWMPLGGDYGDKTPPWIIGVHLISALCLYDTMFTFVLLAHCCLFTEMNADYRARLNMKWWSVIAHLCAGVSVPLANHFSDNLACLPCFRWTCVCVAITATVCMVFTGLRGHTLYEDARPAQLDKPYQGSIWKIYREILSERDFHGFVWLNFLHQGHSVFLNNFMSIFMDFLVPGLSTSFLNVYYTLQWTLPPLTIILFRGFIESTGYYSIIRAACIIKIVSSASIWLIGKASYIFLAYFLFDNILIHSISNLYDIALSDIADKDRSLHKRKQPISSMIYAGNALITKPAISLFPMIVVGILGQYGYQGVVKQLGGANRQDVVEVDYNLSGVIFNVACGVPFIVGVLQYISWSFYSIRASHKSENAVSVVDDGI